MRPSFHDLPLLDDQNLIGALDRGQPVRNDEGRATMPQGAQPILNEPLALAVETRGRLVQNENARIGEYRPCDRDSLPLSTRQLHPAFTHNRVVAVLELVDELVAVRNPTHLTYLLTGGVRLAEHNVFDDGTVEQEIFLHYDAELLAEIV